MKHARQLIREAVVAQLSGKTDAGDRVLKSRRIPMREKDLPAVIVSWKSEAVPYPTRNFDLELIAVHAMPDSGDVDDALDTIASQIEAAIAADLTLGQTAIVAKLTGSEAVFYDDARLSVVGLHITYEVRYAA